jgi:hypothetical protein
MYWRQLGILADEEGRGALLFYRILIEVLERA